MTQNRHLTLIEGGLQEEHNVYAEELADHEADPGANFDSPANQAEVSQARSRCEKAVLIASPLGVLSCVGGFATEIGTRIALNTSEQAESPLTPAAGQISAVGFLVAATSIALHDRVLRHKRAGLTKG